MGTLCTLRFVVLLVVFSRTMSMYMRVQLNIN